MSATQRVRARALLAALMAFGTAFVPPLAQAAGAREPTPVGLWRNIDDVSGKPLALIRIAEADGRLTGRIEKLFLAPGDDPNPTCDKCDGALKGAPILGMVILIGLAKSGDEYTGGQILDPDNGKLYRCKLRLFDQGRKLDVRGYIGVPWVGRSQVWLREE